MSNRKNKTDSSFQSTEMCQWLLCERCWLARPSPVRPCIRSSDARNPEVHNPALKLCEMARHYQHLTPSVQKSITTIFLTQVINHENPLPSKKSLSPRYYFFGVVEWFWYTVIYCSIMIPASFLHGKFILQHCCLWTLHVGSNISANQKPTAAKVTEEQGKSFSKLSSLMGSFCATSVSPWWKMHTEIFLK